MEDSRADVFLIREAISTAHVDADLHVVQDGEKAIRFFEQIDRDPSAPCPTLVILDINLPKKHGREVIQHMRRSVRCRNASVLVVTSSDSDHDRAEMKNLGVDGYFRKPSEYQNFMKLGQVVRDLLNDPPRAS